MTQVHPKHAAALAARTAQKAHKAAISAEVTKAIADQGIRFAHVAPYTLAFKIDRRDILSVATSLCHKNDTYSKRFGRQASAMKLLDGQSITMRKPKGMAASAFLHWTFGLAVNLTTEDAKKL